MSTLKGKLILLNGALLVVTVTLISWFTLYQEMNSHREEIKKQAILSGELIAERMHDLLQEHHHLQESIHEHVQYYLDKHPDITRVSYYFAEGNIAYDSESLDLNQFTSFTQLPDAERFYQVLHQGSSVSGTTIIKGKENLLIYAPYIKNEVPESVIKLQISLDNMHRMITRRIFMVVGLAGVVIFFGIFASVILSFKVTSSLDHLIKATGMISKGNFREWLEFHSRKSPIKNEPSPASREQISLKESICNWLRNLFSIPREVWQLEASFIEMVDQLKQRDLDIDQAQSELRNLNLKLEEIVADRTRQLEDTLHRVEQQNTTLAISNRRLEELNQDKEQLLKRMNKIKDTNLSSLKRHLNEMLNATVIDSKDILRQAMRDTLLIEESLAPLSTLYYSEKAISHKRVLLAEDDPKQQIIARMALGGTGVNLAIVNTVQEGIIQIKQCDYDIICVNTSLIRLAEIAQQQMPAAHFVLMTSDDAPDYLPQLRQYPFMSNIVARNDQDRMFTLKNILTTISKLISEDLFGLEKYLSWGVEVQERPVVSSEVRTELVDEMEAYFKQLGVRKSILERSSMAAEELLMNSIYDAPTDAHGMSQFNHLSRKEPVFLKPDEQSVLRYACDGLLLAISVADPFGSFHRETILDTLIKCYEGQAKALDTDHGGAGRGLMQIMATSDLVVFNVKPMVRTEVIAIFNINPKNSNNERATSFHYFYG